MFINGREGVRGGGSRICRNVRKNMKEIELYHGFIDNR